MVAVQNSPDRATETLLRDGYGGASPETHQSSPVVSSTDLSPAVAVAGAVASLREDPYRADASSSAPSRARISSRPEVGASTSRFVFWSRRYVQALFALDVLAGLAAVLVGSLMPRALTLQGPQQALLVLAGALAWPLGISLARGYERAQIGVGGDEVRAVLRASVVLIAAGSVASVLFNTNGLSALVVLGTPIAMLSSVGTRFCARRVLHHRQRQGHHVRRVLVVGSAYAVSDLATVLERESHAGMRVVGVCVPRSDATRADEAGLHVLGDLEQVPELIRSSGVDAVAVTGGEATRHHYLRELSWALEGAGVELLVHPGLIEVAGPRMHIRPYVGLPLLHVEQPHFTGWRRILKRAADLGLGIVGVLCAAPVLLAIAAAIKLQDGGPVIFRQTRVGLDGTTFTMLKFRSMHLDAEERLAELRARHPNMGTLFKLADDPRVTPVGRFLRKYSLDELPQLVNVLGGSMSMVGPRPPLQSEVDQYEDHARRRLLVTPGLTGLWQVSGRSLLSWEETVRLDLRYVENWTLTLDLLILWKTLFAVLAKRGAF